MRKGVARLSTGLTTVLCLSTGWAVGAQAADAGPDAKDTAVGAMFGKYCVSCHNFTDWAGGLALDGFDLSDIGNQAEEGEKIVLKLRAGMMPPHGEDRPDAKTVAAAVDTLEAKLDAAAAAHPMLPPPGLHRLNRQEYADAVRDLLGVDVDVSSMLPVDDSNYGFDNIAGTLGSSPALIEAYVSAASKISRTALGDVLEPRQVNYSAAPDLSQDDHVEDASFGSRGGLVIEHYFPADGEYVINWAPVRSNAGGLFGETTGEKLELSIDGQRVKLYDIDKEVSRSDHEDHHEVRVKVKAGTRKVQLAFVSLTSIPRDDLNEHFERTTLTQSVGGFIFSAHVNMMSISGPFNAVRPEHTASRDKIFVCRPSNAAEEEPCARTILSSLARQAYRRPVTSGDMTTLMSIYSSERQSGGNFEDGIQLGLQLILADPNFIYRTEPVPANVAAGKTYPVSDLELASRLSFFLWSSIPDNELLTVASQGKLRDPGVLEAQVTRMLKDPRSHALVTNFAAQWLQLRNLGASSPVADIFPDFDDNLRQAFTTEVEMFFESIMREDRSVVDLLDADYTFLNDRLARHYGIPGVYGSQFRRVKLGPEFDMRRGLLGKGAILTVTSNADRTSTIRRGQWVDINLLGVRPPDPPPNVPGLAAQEEHGGVAKLQTLRDRMTEHATNPACAACHQMMDPVGFALESFNAIGQWRNDEYGQKLDLSGWLVDGTKFDGPSQLREALMRFAPQFVQTMTIRLMTYALGRGVEYYDMPTVRSVVKEADAKGDKFSAFVMAIVESAPFQNNQAAEKSLAEDHNVNGDRADALGGSVTKVAANQPAEGGPTAAGQ